MDKIALMGRKSPGDTLAVEPEIQAAASVGPDRPLPFSPWGALPKWTAQVAVQAHATHWVLAGRQGSLE